MECNINLECNISVSTVLYSALLTLLYCTVLYYTVQYSTIQCYTGHDMTPHACTRVCVCVCASECPRCAIGCSLEQEEKI